MLCRHTCSMLPGVFGACVAVLLLPIGTALVVDGAASFLQAPGALRDELDGRDPARRSIFELPRSSDPTVSLFRSPKKHPRLHSRHRKVYNATPEEIERRNTSSGRFQVFQFPLSFSKTALYWRRFGVDTPPECERPGCPVLFDFHGSYDSLYTQRNWTKWWKYLAQVEPSKKFILVTPEGSPDAVTYSDIKVTGRGQWEGKVSTSATSWNVLGWGNLTDAMDETASCPTDGGSTVADSASGPAATDAAAGAGSSRLPLCFKSALQEDSAYPCYGTHLEEVPQLCTAYSASVLKSPYNRQDPGHQMFASGKCASASAANDWDYMKVVLSFMDKTFGIDKSRIYFSGQSMGGMASIQFSVESGRYALPPDLRPAGIAPCSASGSRLNDVELGGKTPTLLMHGSYDLYAPGTVWSGFSRDCSDLRKSTEFRALLSDEAVMEKVANLTRTEKLPAGRRKRARLFLLADLMAVGTLAPAATAKMGRTNQVGCLDTHGNFMTLDMSGIMWESIPTTLSRVAGRKVDIASLKFEPPASVPFVAAFDVSLMCATVPNTKSEIRFCVYEGGHEFPWMGNIGPRKRVDGMGFLPSAKSGKVLHDFIYEDFFKGGKLRRSD